MDYVDPCLYLISMQELIDSDDLTPSLNAIESLGILTKKHQNYIDFGCYAYLARKSIDGRTHVITSTLDPARVYLLQNLLDDIANDLRTGRKRIVSVWTSILGNLKPIFTWLDTQAKSNSLETAQDLNLRFAEYTTYLLELKETGNQFDDLSSRRQYAARKFFQLASTDPKLSLGQGVPIILRPIAKPVPPPEESAVTENLAMAYQLFTQLTDFVLDFNPYPLKLTLPKETVHVIPCNTWTMINARLDTRDQMQSPNWCWDYKNGKLNSVEYVQIKYKYLPSKAKQQLTKAASYLASANNDPRHHRRITLGSWARSAFQILMLSTTGMDLESFRNLPWDDDIISIPSDRQGFRIYKARAGKTVYFEIQSTFVPLFNKYLKLRRFILNGTKCRHLFFRINHGIALKIDDKFLQTYHDLISHMLDASLPRLTATEYRKYKANWILDRKGPAVASLVMQNTIPVFASRYSSSARKTRLTEFTKLFTYISSLSQSVLDTINDTPSGGCIGDQTPEDIGTNLGLEKNCKTFWCCLFCTHYALHADAEDLYKLKSMIFAIELVRENSQDFTPALEQTLDRAKSYVKLVIEQNPELIEVEQNIEKQLAAGTLYSYWQAYVNLWSVTGAIK